MYDVDEYAGDAPDDGAVLRAVPDLAGLEVEDASGIPVGELFGALIEADTGLIRYVDLELANAERHVLVPIGHTRIREKERDEIRMRLRAALLEELEQIPPYPPDLGHIDDPFERALLEAYGRTFHGERYYAHPSYDHNGVYAEDQPVIGEAVADQDQPLMRMSYLSGWRVARGEPDIRRWPLLLQDGTRLEVRDLIVETAAGRVRYVVASDGKQSRLLPVGFISIDRDARTATAGSLTAADLAALPPYDGGGVSRQQEERVHAALRESFSGRRRYNLPDFRGDERAAAGERQPAPQE